MSGVAERLPAGLRRRVTTTRAWQAWRLPRPVYCYFGHHKAATVTINGVMSEMADAVGRTHLALVDSDAADGDIGRMLQQRPIGSISYTNAQADVVTKIRDARVRFRAIHVIRDPRDLVVSAYFSHLRSHGTSDWPELEVHRDRLQSLDEEAGMLAELDFLVALSTAGHVHRPIHAMHEWPYTSPEILELRFEELVGNEKGFFRRAASHLGVLQDSAAAGTITSPALEQIVERHTFERHAGGRTHGEADPNSHYRKGIVGDWREHFTPPVVERFVELFGTVVEDLGYEADASWVNDV